jgi:hypothetical protein
MLAGQSNEFALLNNGITMLSDETYINERIGQRNKAQLSLKNPQIINGGQTAYTLSRLYEEFSADLTPAFADKEVLLKVITLIEGGSGRLDSAEKARLIERISTATNRQSEVTSADRHSGDEAFLRLQKLIFDRYGVLVEIKRGEFQDGIKDGYIQQRDILERNLFCRIFYSSNGFLNKARRKKVFVNFSAFEATADYASLDKFYFGLLCYRQFRNTDGDVANRKRQEAICQAYAACLRYFPGTSGDFEERANEIGPGFRQEWNAFKQHLVNTGTFVLYREDRLSGTKRPIFQTEHWLVSGRVEDDIKSYFSPGLGNTTSEA